MIGIGIDCEQISRFENYSSPPHIRIKYNNLKPKSR